MMSGNSAAREDRRVVRTRAALIAAFNRIFLHRRQRGIRVAEIVEEANVGRSTFYEHFAGAEAIRLEAMKSPFAVLADAAAGRGDRARMEALLEHFWENRQRGREMLSGRAGEQAVRLLAGLIAERLKEDGRGSTLPLPLAARQLAEAALGPLKPWIAGESPCPVPVLADALCRLGERLAGGDGSG